MKLRTFSTLQIALGVSVAVHAGLLTLRLADPQAFNRVFEDTPLEVILVNTRSNDKPGQAQAIAQASLAGGGEHAQGRATSPLPPALASLDGEDGNQDQDQPLRTLQERQALLLAQVRTSLAAMAPTDPQQASLASDVLMPEQKRRQLIKMLAEIERRISEDNARPKRRYISPATQEAAYAVYYDRLRRAIEDKGTENFPQVNGQKLYGELTMKVIVNHDGRLVSTDVVQSSGNPALDRRARAIARNASPFGKFSKGMRRQIDQLVVISRFKFTRDDLLEARVGKN